MLTIAFPKGYLFDEAMSLFNKMGFVFSEDLKQSRKLFTKDKSSQIRILQIRPWDVTEYVEYGAADLGIVGRDVLEEKNNSVAQLMDLHFGKCRLVLACSKKQKKNPFYHNMRVATKYPYLTTKYFEKRSIKIQLIKLYGAVELAPITGLSDIICDLTATGKTLQENQLDILDTILNSTAILIANPVSLKLHYKESEDLFYKIQSALS